MMIGYRGGVSVGEIIVYTPAFALATLLALRDGFGRSGGWIFLMTFSLARITGAGFQLATISHPTVSNFTASAVLTSVGFGPLELAALSLLSRIIADINKTSKTLITTQMVKMVELVLTVGVILGLVGGINAGNEFDKKGTFVLGAENKAGTALVLAAFILTVLGTVVISFDITHASREARRVFWALVASLPFLLIRLVYSCLSTYSQDKKFSLLQGSTTILLCVAYLQELAVVIIYESVGLTLKKQPKQESIDISTTSRTKLGSEELGSPAAQPQQQDVEPREHIALRLAKHIIFVRIGIWAYKSITEKK